MKQIYNHFNLKTWQKTTDKKNSGFPEELNQNQKTHLFRRVFYIFPIDKLYATFQG